MSTTTELVLGGLTAVTGGLGAILGYRQAAKANRISDKTADGAAYERAMKIYEKTIDLQGKDLDTSRARNTLIEARLLLLEEDLTNARIRIGDLEQFIMHAGLAVPPDGPFRAPSPS